ncbi:MAG: hypothetical protein HQK49_11530 [Oligoflexia bacterium]|nr:hypothetical protein [Oligoflexia bacterium]
MIIKFKKNSLLSNILTSLVKSNQNSLANVIVVSDLDDTLRMTDVRNTGNAIVNHIIGIRPFQMLIDIYQQIKEYYESTGDQVMFYYLSSSPRIVDIKDWLKFHGAPEGIVRQRGFLEFFERGSKYKSKELKKFLKQYIEQHKIRSFAKNFVESEEFRDLLKGNELLGYEFLPNSKKSEKIKDIRILFFGDNGQYDPIVYSNVFKDPDLDFKGNNIEAHIFIRKVVTDVEDLPGINYFNDERELLEDPAYSSILNLNRGDIKKQCG